MSKLKNIFSITCKSLEKIEIKLIAILLNNQHSNFMGPILFFVHIGL